MQDARFLLEASPWFVLVSLLVGGAYAAFMYWRKGPWPITIHRLLAGLRFVVVSLLCFLLLGPLLRQIQNQYEDPTLVIALDNSSSLAQVNDSVALAGVVSALEALGESLEGEFAVEYRTLDGETTKESFANRSFSHPASPLSELLADVKADYEGRNLAGVVLASDGIYNQGPTPAYETFAFPVHTLGLGDTLPKQDLVLQAVFYNQIAYQGNRFPVVAEVLNEGFAGSRTQVRIRQQGQVLASQTVTFSAARQVQEVQFLLEAKTEGLQRYTVEVLPLEGEFTPRNNQRNVYLDVVEGREKVLLAAASPHPDLKALRTALEKNANYEVTVYIPSLQEYVPEKYDVVILHQLPSARQGIPAPIQQLLAEGASAWFIWGSQTNLAQFNQVNSVLEVTGRPGQTDQVTPIFQSSFSRFRYTDEHMGVVNRFPPVEVPFGTIQLKGAAEVLLQQRVGSVETSNPLWVVSTDEANKQAVLLGSGIWQWRLQEYARTQSQVAFDELVSKTVQYLSSKEDRRKFKVYPVVNEFTESEPVILGTEVYNDIYEPVYGQNISLTLTDEAGKTYDFAYATSPANTRYRIGGLVEGVYRLKATTTVDGEVLTSEGAFTVKDLQLEEMNLTADHALLRSLAEQSGGVYATEAEALRQVLESQPAQALIHTSEQFLPLVSLPWVFFLVLLLVTVEWVLRRYFGSY